MAYWAGEFVSSYTLAKLKLMAGGRFLWTRTIGSTLSGQFCRYCPPCHDCFRRRTNQGGFAVDVAVSGSGSEWLFLKEKATLAASASGHSNCETAIGDNCWL